MLTKQKKSEVTILISNCRAENITRYKESYFIMIQGSIYQEDRRILNGFVSNNRVSQCIKQKLTEVQGKIGKLAVIARNVNISLNNRTSIQKLVRI